MTNDKQKNRLVELLQECQSNYSEDKADHLIKNNVIVLPHVIGEKIFCLAQPCGGCKCFKEPMQEDFIETCQKCDKWEICECKFDYDLIPEWGKLVFPTRELAKEALRKKLEEVRECK